MTFLVYSGPWRTLALSRRMKGRLIAIGDIHGCHLEFADLLARLAPQPGDRVVLLGDLVNRGPDSCAVIEQARTHLAIALLGNHERRLLEYRRTGAGSRLKDEDRLTVARLRSADWAFLEAMPLTYEAPEYEAVFVHGGFLPTSPWRGQPAEVVTRIQVIDSQGRPARRADVPGAPPWADMWRGPPTVVYGHTPRREIYRRKWSLGIDTGCVLGGRLTAFEFPARRISQVTARRRYWR